MSQTASGIILPNQSGRAVLVVGAVVPHQTIVQACDEALPEGHAGIVVGINEFLRAATDLRRPQ